MTDIPHQPKMHVHRINAPFGDRDATGILYQVLPEDIKALCP